MKIGVLPNLDKRGAAQAVEKMGKLFKDWGYTAYLPDSMVGTDYIHLPENEIYEKADIIVTVGGDGTIIRYAKLAARAGKPVLGVNAPVVIGHGKSTPLAIKNMIISTEHAIKNRLIERLTDAFR